MTGLLLLLLAALVADSPKADWRWVGLSESEDGRRAWYIDKASLVRDGDKIGFTELAIFRPAGQPRVMKEESYRVEGDCAARTMIVYEHDRSSGAERPGVTIRAEPKSAGGDMLDSVCKGRFAGRVRDVVGNAILLFQVTPRKKAGRR